MVKSWFLLYKNLVLSSKKQVFNKYKNIKKKLKKLQNNLVVIVKCCIFAV